MNWVLIDRGILVPPPPPDFYLIAIGQEDFCPIAHRSGAWTWGLAIATATTIDIARHWGFDKCIYTG